MTQADLQARVNECLGLNQSEGERTPDQQRKIKTLADVIHIHASAMPSHMNWAMWRFWEVVQQRTPGARPRVPLTLSARRVGVPARCRRAPSACPIKKAPKNGA